MNNNNLQTIDAFDISPERFNSHNSDALVISCIDPRFSYAIWSFMNKQHPNNFDAPISTPGGAKSLSQEGEEKNLIIQYIEISIKLHNINNIYLFTHSNCGGYNIEDLQQEQAQQIQDLQTAKEIVEQEHPDIKIHCIIADGHTEQNPENPKIQMKQLP